ncbi:MAG TPA: tRNA-(ms[2]io[6]A)-hydroxylase [Saprospiraceae bacterium]|nr:tRNA-(ms[2]io[6]A)-hydroxylase [Saprospiraceae bacterium]
MKYNLEVLSPSPAGWIEAVMNDFDSFLISHADGERKVSAFALGLVAKYPSFTKIVPALIEMGVEELEHFQQVYGLMDERGLVLPQKIAKDMYMVELTQQCRHGRMDRLMDRLIIGSLVEIRALERFKLVADHLTDPALKRFYKILWASEVKHGTAYIDLAMKYFEQDKVLERAQWFFEYEADLIQRIEIKPALH